MQMVPTAYVIRRIEDADRADHVRELERAQARGDLNEVQIIKDVFAQWEREQGQQKERLACPVCGDSWLVPIAKGTSRPHRLP